MGSFIIEFAEEVIEAGLLLERVHGGWPGGFLLEGEMHALVAPILLRTAWLDAFDGDAEPEPPDGEFGEVIEAVGACEGQAVVGSDGIGQALLIIPYGAETLVFHGGGR